jgi:hypothetical protein
MIYYKFLEGTSGNFVEAVSQLSPEETEDNHENLGRHNSYPVGDSKLASLEQQSLSLSLQNPLRQ